MSCKEFRMMISRELDGAVEAVERERLERHLAACAGCRRFKELSLAGLSIHRSVKEANPPPSLVPSILAAVEARRDTEWIHGWLRVAVPAAAAAAAAFGIWVGGLIHESSTPNSTGDHADVLELSYLDEYPPGSLGDILMASNEGGGNGQR
jgi:predicted anti-sigma-YlaC factor YlaD